MPTYRVREVTASDQLNDHCMDTDYNPSFASMLAGADAVFYHNQGVDLAAIGQYGAAEQSYLKALKIKKKFIGKDAISTAHSHYTLGGLYVATNRLDDAEKHLAIAVRVRNADAVGPTFDAAAARETLAVVYEMKGDLVAAKQMRKSTGKFACGNYEKVCPIPSPPDDLSLMFVPYSVYNKFSIRPNSDNVPGALYVLRAVFLCLNTNITCRLFSIVLRYAR